MPQTFEHRGRIVEAEMRTSAPPTLVWQAWADPLTLSQWFTDRATGQPIPGGTFTWYFDRFHSEYPYQVWDAVPERRLVLAGAPPGRPPYVLEVLISREGDETLLRILNSGFNLGEETEEEFEGVRSGWVMALAILKHYLENHFGKDKSIFFAMQAAPFSYDQVLHFFLEPAGLARWLTREGGIGMPGEDYALTLRGGERMSGKVLTLTRREVALSWDQVNGVIEFKSFNLSPRTRALCLRGCAWGLSPEGATEIEALLNPALDRLVKALADPATSPGSYVH